MNDTLPHVFGVSSRNSIFGKVHCIGTEPNMFECSHTSVGFHTCGRNTPPVPDITVSCYGEQFSCVCVCLFQFQMQRTPVVRREK